MSASDDPLLHQLGELLRACGVSNILIADDLARQGTLKHIGMDRAVAEELCGMIVDDGCPWETVFCDTDETRTAWQSFCKALEPHLSQERCINEWVQYHYDSIRELPLFPFGQSCDGNYPPPGAVHVTTSPCRLWSCADQAPGAGLSFVHRTVDSLRTARRPCGPAFMFHGTTHLAAAEILDGGIDLTISDDRNDFGQGFYMTQDPAHAMWWANTGSRRRAPALLIFEDISTEHEGWVQELHLTATSKPTWSDIVEWKRRRAAEPPRLAISDRTTYNSRFHFVHGAHADPVAGSPFSHTSRTQFCVRQSSLAVVWRDALVAVIFLSPERATFGK